MTANTLANIDSAPSRLSVSNTNATGDLASLQSSINSLLDRISTDTEDLKHFDGASQ
jgi:hypothetical protein